MDADNLWTQMTPDQREAFGMARIGQLLDRAAIVQTRFDDWTVCGSSRLAEDNSWTSDFHPMTHELHYLMSSALDHLAAVDSLVRIVKTLTPFAPFSLIRSALESAAVGLWLQNGGTLDKRVFRLIQLQWSQRESVDVHSRSMGIDPKPNTRLLAVALDNTKARRSHLAQNDYTRRMTRTTEIITETDRLFRPRLVPSGLNTWRSCSGVTHGNGHFTTALVNTTPIFPPSRGGATRLNTASAASTSLMLGGAIDYVERFMTVLETHGKARPGIPDF